MNAKHTYRVTHRNDLRGINVRELIMLHPSPVETNEERIARQARKEPHPKVIAAQERFEELLQKRTRRSHKK
ncbi:hypothetical protein LCGC14_0481840 [marine sediment metagenome]|uniref:Uncharacterized protein n=1 Tax=marine sediment metagenome TaxID=412755 RepID=A0A0F9SEJ6_9ZZZZ